MSYTKQHFSDGQTLTAAMLNKIENGIVQNEKDINNIQLTPGPQGPKGEKGDPGEPGTPADLSGYATEDFVTQKIEEASLEGGTDVDLSEYAKTADIEANYQPKGDYITEHQPIKSINGQSLVGEGNIQISGESASETIFGDVSSSISCGGITAGMSLKGKSVTEVLTMLLGIQETSNPDNETPKLTAPVIYLETIDDEVEVPKLAAPVIYLTTASDPGENTPAISGTARLGRTIMGKI